MTDESIKVELGQHMFEIKNNQIYRNGKLMQLTPDKKDKLLKVLKNLGDGGATKGKYDETGT